MRHSTAREREQHSIVGARGFSGARPHSDEPDQEYRELHARTADLMYRNGFPAAEVAAHLVEARDVRSSWASRVLVAAADEALTGDELDRAGRYLELAYRSARRADERAAITTRLVAVDWRINPSSRTRNFARLKAALRTGRIPRTDLPATVLYTLWHGYGRYADYTLTRLSRDPDDGGSAELDFLCAWLRYTHPAQAQRHPILLPGRPVDTKYPARDSTSPHRQASDLLRALCTPPDRNPAAPHSRSSAPGTQRDEIAAAAQRLLAQHRLTLTTVEPLVAAVDCLIHTDRLDTADDWCASLLAEAAARCAPTWQSIFVSARAETLLRKGDLTGAAENAVLALNLLPAEQLGVWVGRPIAVLVCALTAQGKHAEAAAQLERPVPRAMFESRFGLLYLQAMGRHCLATGRYPEALGHFRRCGRLMREWNLDFAWLSPWRNDMAAACLAAGQQWQAQTFATRHLDLIGGPEQHHTGSVSLRLLAATGAAPRRTALLRRAAGIARAGGDQLELATALAELGAAHRAIGDTDKARPLLREAARLGNACDSATVRERLREADAPAPFSTATPVPPRIRPTAGAVASLSPAERRVAELAARGKRNRDIAVALDITASTVEQHLTRVYRKLAVTRRGELRFALLARTDVARTAVG